MDSFLAQLASKITEREASSRKGLLIVLPNQRARRMLQNELAKRLAKPAFVPAIVSINDFIESLSPLQKLDHPALLALLFEVYDRIKQKTLLQPADFNEMMAWAVSFLNDINDIDVQMADGMSIFSTLYSAKDFEIRYGKESITPKMQEQSAFYAMLGELYAQFSICLLQNKQGYEGLIYRNCAEHIEEYARKLKHAAFVFAGFHVLTPAELAIVKYFQENYQTDFYFDIDPFYCNFKKEDKFSTAYFLKQICHSLSLSPDKIQFHNDDYAQTDKDIQVVGLSKSMNQIHYAIGQLNKIKREQGNLEDTVVVLADERLLVPFCSAYDCSDVNITMGFPLSETPAYALLTDLLDCYRPDLNNEQNYGIQGFRHRDILALLQHPLVRKAFPTEKRATMLRRIELCRRSIFTMDTLKEILSKNIYLKDDKEEIFSKEDIKSFLASFPVLPESLNDLLDSVIAYLQDVANRIPQEEREIFLPFLLEHLQQMDDRICALMRSGKLNYPTIRSLITMQLEGLSIPMDGDPLHGLQVMGLLETRTLDFKNVIMLSVNEGILPSGINFSSLIPFEFKFEGNALEKYLYKDQVYAYHFFRLLQRAKNVVLIYDHDSSDKMAEKSRFIRQLEFETNAHKLENIHISYPVVTVPFSFASHEIDVPKTEPIMAELLKYAYSASALNTYVNCPLQFYLQHICKIKPADMYEDKIGADVVGTAIHELFAAVFDKIKNNRVSYKRIIDDFLSDLDNKVITCLEKLNLDTTDLGQGRGYLTRQIIEKEVKNYLNRAKDELTNGDLILQDFELEMVSSIEMNTADIKLKGIIDRIQRRNEIVEILDYKTGAVQEDRLRIRTEADLNDDKWSEIEKNAMTDELNMLLRDPENKYLLQLLFYVLLYHHHDSSAKEFKCGIISLMHCNEQKEYLHYVTCAKPKSRDKTVLTIKQNFMEVVEIFFKNLLSEIIDTKIPFRQTVDTDRCRYCDFIYLCGRKAIKQNY